MLSSAAATASAAPGRSVLLIGQDHPDDEQRERPAVLARDWGLLPKLREKPCKGTPSRTTLTGTWASKMPCKLASFSHLARLPFTQEITGSNPVGGTYGSLVVAAVLVATPAAAVHVSPVYGSVVVIDGANAARGSPSSGVGCSRSVPVIDQILEIIEVPATGAVGLRGTFVA